METVDRGLYINGNFTGAEIEGADWVEKDDSILKAQVAVQVKVRFDGGVYRDTDYIDMSKKELGVRAEDINRKEDIFNGENTGAGGSAAEGE